MSAPLNNRFALGNNGGRPPIYDTPEQMLLKASEYFEIETQKNGICKPTISGLTFHLGFSTRQSWYNYKDKSKEFLDSINMMQTFIESCYEKNLHGYSFAGSIFALKNINPTYWKDKIETENTNVNTNVEASFGTTLPATHQPSEDTPID